MSVGIAVGHRGAKSLLHFLAVVLAIGLLAPCTGRAAALDMGTLTGGGAVGFLSNTPDGTAFAFNLNADYFIHQNVSVGPLFQLATTGDLLQAGFSGQGKFWIDLPDPEKRMRLNFQGGIGFLHSDLFGSDTSWLIPIGVGWDYAVHPKLSLTATLLINFTDVNPGVGSRTHVMPGMTFGVRF